MPTTAQKIPKGALTVPADAKECPKCGAKHSMEMTIYSDYMSIYYVPIVTLGKKGVITCKECDLYAEDRHMGPISKEQFKREKSKVRIPIWHFSGLFGIAVILIGIVISDVLDKRENDHLILDPQAGDVYVYKTEDEHYTTFKITGRSEDSIFFINNEYEVFESTDIYSINSEKKYDDEERFLFFGELYDMYVDGTIIDIKR